MATAAAATEYGERIHADIERLIESLTDRDAFAELTAEQLTALVPVIRIKDYRDSEIVCHCPDITHDVLVVLDGRVAVTREKDGMLHTLQIEGPDAVVNGPRLFGDPPPYTGSRALGQVTSLAIAAPELQKLMNDDPALGVAIASGLIRIMLRQHEAQLDSLLD
jgi:CRP-like cAMP-binding protein